jgi:hypothetical protein
MPDFGLNPVSGRETSQMPKSEIRPNAKPVDASCVFRAVLSGKWRNEVQRSHRPQRPKWPIPNLGMLISTKCNVRINLRAMVLSISHD